MSNTSWKSEARVHRLRRIKVPTASRRKRFRRHLSASGKLVTAPRVLMRRYTVTALFAPLCSVPHGCNCHAHWEPCCRSSGLVPFENVFPFSWASRTMQACAARREPSIAWLHIY